jgi:hypothetical protein
MILGRGQGNEFSRRQLPLNSHFLPSDKLKIQIQRGLKIVNLRVRLTLRYHFLPLVKMKNDLASDEKWCFRVFDDFAQLIPAFLSSQKFDLVEVQKAMFNVISYRLYLIFYFLINRKLFLREVEKDDSRVRLALFIHILPSNIPKIRLVRGRESNYSGEPHSLQIIILPSWSI